MVQVARLIHTTTEEMAHSAKILPAPIISVITLFNSVHRIWRWFRLGEIYSNPNNFLKLAAGHGLNFACGNSLILRISAICVLIATRILDCVAQHFKLQKAWKNLVLACQDRYPTPIKVKWRQKTTLPFLSASEAIFWKFRTKKVLNKIKRISTCLFSLLKNIFILSMRITDVIETFSLSPATKNEGIHLLFVNSEKWVDQLVENKTMLIEGIACNKKLIDKILKSSGSPLTAEQLSKTAALALEKTEKVHKGLKAANKGVGAFLSACVQKWGYEFLYELGLHRLVPQNLVPPPTPPWEKSEYQQIKERFVPIHLITKASMLDQEKPRSNLEKLLEELSNEERKPSSYTPLISPEKTNQAPKKKQGHKIVLI